MGAKIKKYLKQKNLYHFFIGANTERFKSQTPEKHLFQGLKACKVLFGKQ